MNTKRIVSVSLILSALLAACGAPAAPMAAPTSAPAATAAPEATAAAAPAAGYDTGKVVNDVVPPIPRMIIRNATLVLVVRDTQAQIDAIMRMADELKGFVASSNTTKDGNDLQAQMVLRIPAERMDEAMERLRTLAVEVRQEQVSGNDVTAEYVDLNSQVKNLEAAEEQLRGILAKAEKTEDVLNVFNQLTSVRGQIEQAKGRMQFLSQSAALATINLSLVPDKPALPVEAPGWRPEGVAKTALEKLIGSLQSLADVVIWTGIYVLPMLVLVLTPIFVVAWLLRLRNRRKTTTA